MSRVREFKIGESIGIIITFGGPVKCAWPRYSAPYKKTALRKMEFIGHFGVYFCILACLCTMFPFEIFSL